MTTIHVTAYSDMGHLELSPRVDHQLYKLVSNDVECEYRSQGGYSFAFY